MHKRLKCSLDRFSKDLSRLLKVSELNQRLSGEIAAVLHTDAAIVSLDPKQNICSMYGSEALGEEVKRHSKENGKPAIYELQWRGDICLSRITERGAEKWLALQAGLLNEDEQMWLETLIRLAGVTYDNFAASEELFVQFESVCLPQEAPPWLLRMFFLVREKERFQLSQDLHGSVLQEQLLWIRRLSTLAESAQAGMPFALQLTEITEGMLDVVYQIRLMCTELSPPFLQEFGLVASLEALFESVQKQADYEILFDSSHFDAGLDEEQTFGLYRIVQELLANASKHSKADTVFIAISNDHHMLEMNYADNGSGFAVDKAWGRKHMGIYGIRQRIRSLKGEVCFQSDSAGGLKVWIKLPLNPVSIEPQTEV